MYLVYCHETGSSTHAWENYKGNENAIGRGRLLRPAVQCNICFKIDDVVTLKVVMGFWDGEGPDVWLV